MNNNPQPSRELIKDRWEKLKQKSQFSNPLSNSSNVLTQFSQSSSPNTPIQSISPWLSTSQIHDSTDLLFSKTSELKSQFETSLSSNDGTVSKDKFAYFIEQANETFLNYEKQIKIYKMKTTFFDSSSLSIQSSTNIWDLIPTQREQFNFTVSKISNDSIEQPFLNSRIKVIYENKINELFHSNETLSQMVDKMSTNVINKLQEKIYVISDLFDKEKEKNDNAQVKLQAMDSVISQNSDLKAELSEKLNEIQELNWQQISNMNQIENYCWLIKQHKEEIKTKSIEHERLNSIIASNENTIQTWKESIDEKDKIILEWRGTITEQESEIQWWYNDNVQWEEKHAVQGKEIENYKKWSLLDLNLIEAFKKIELLDKEIHEKNEIIAGWKDENSQWKALNEDIQTDNVNYKTMNTSLKYENEGLLWVKKNAEKQQEQFNYFIRLEKEYDSFKKELKLKVDKYENEIMSKTWEYDKTLSESNEKHSKQVNELKTVYENKIKEDREKYDKDIQRIINDSKETIDKVKYWEENNKALAEQLDKKGQTWQNLKDAYDSMIKKLKAQDDQIKAFEKSQMKPNFESGQGSSCSSWYNNDTGKEESDQPFEGNRNGINKINSTFDKFSFTKEMLIDYWYCWYWLESSISMQSIHDNIISNFNTYFNLLFIQGNNGVSSYFVDFIEDIYYIAFDKIITKRIANSVPPHGKDLFHINFEDFDKMTINAISVELLKNSFIARWKRSKGIEQIVTLFLGKYDKKFEFDNIKLSEYLTTEVIPTVEKRVEKYALTILEDVKTLVELTWHNWKDGRVYNGDDVVYSFEDYYKEYKKFKNIVHRNKELFVYGRNEKKCRGMNNVLHVIKYDTPKEVGVVNYFKNRENDDLLHNLLSYLSLFNGNVQHLDFSNNKLTGVVFTSRLLTLLNSFPCWTKLNWSSNSLTADEIKRLCEMIKTNKTIKSLNWSDNDIKSSGGFYIADALMKNSTLAVWDISKNMINNSSDSGLSSILNVLSNNNHTLKDLNISENELQKKDFTAIAEFLASNTSLEVFDISNNVIQEFSANVIGVSLKKCKHWKVLKWNQTGWTDETCSQLWNNLNWTSINEIELDMNFLGDTGIMILINKIKLCENIKKLSLRNCEITPFILSFIGQSFKSTDYIEFINWESNSFDDVDFGKFCLYIRSNDKIKVQFSKSLLSANAKEMAVVNKKIVFV